MTTPSSSSIRGEPFQQSQDRLKSDYSAVCSAIGLGLSEWVSFVRGVETTLSREGKTFISAETAEEARIFAAGFESLLQSGDDLLRELVFSSPEGFDLSPGGSREV